MNDDIRVGTLHDRSQFIPLRVWDLEFIQRLFKVVNEGIPFLPGDAEVSL
jgi:hypothetical protein